jgi:four helix bundle protein
MSTIKRFEDLEVWKLSRVVYGKVFELTSVGEFAKDYGLKDQIRRAFGSIMDNIAEGFDRGGNKEFKLFLSYAKGSSGEVKSQLYRALDSNYINQEAFEELYHELDVIGGKLGSFIKYLSSTNFKGPKFK